MKKQKYLYIIIVGCGRLGSYLANRLSRKGHSVVSIDNKEAAFYRLSPEYSGFRLEGDATELDILKKAKIGEADILVAATHEDNINLMVAQVAKKVFFVPRVIARVFDLEREEIYRLQNIETVCPTAISAESFLAVLQDHDSYIRGTII